MTCQGVADHTAPDMLQMGPVHAAAPCPKLQVLHSTSVLLSARQGAPGTTCVCRDTRVPCALLLCRRQRTQHLGNSVLHDMHALQATTKPGTAQGANTAWQHTNLHALHDTAPDACTAQCCMRCIHCIVACTRWMHCMTLHNTA